jgi:hypothetical protein
MGWDHGLSFLWRFYSDGTFGTHKCQSLQAFRGSPLLVWKRNNFSTEDS